jgi:hypothetical protein
MVTPPLLLRERIRSLFLHPSPYYAISTARLLGMTQAALKREAEDDQRAAYRSGGRWRFSWRQVAYVAFRTWTLTEIYGALGKDAVSVLPPLLALRAVTVTLPEFIIRAMETAAEDDGSTLDAWLHFEMMDFASTVTARMEAILPGYRRAYLYPGRS